MASDDQVNRKWISDESGNQVPATEGDEFRVQFPSGIDVAMKFGCLKPLLWKKTGICRIFKISAF